ncbi:MAG: hypothetical protein F2735_01235 [Actinobacteria bacterium]|nr:hypothetical protein [Actinomycetota bacterium]
MVITDMTLIAVGTVNGSCGATTLAYDLVARAGNGALLIEADPDGGCLAACLDVALKPGLMELAGAARTGIDADDVWRFAQTTRDGVAVVVAHPSAEQTNAALRAALGHVLAAVAGVDTIVVVDIGRIRPGSASLAAAASADHTIVVSNNSLEATVALAHRSQLLSACASPMVVLNTAQPYGVADVADATHQRVWGVIAAARTQRQQRSRDAALDALLRDLCASSDGDGVEETAFATPLQVTA